MSTLQAVAKRPGSVRWAFCGLLVLLGLAALVVISGQASAHLPAAGTKTWGLTRVEADGTTNDGAVEAWIGTSASVSTAISQKDFVVGDVIYVWAKALQVGAVAADHYHVTVCDVKTEDALNQIDAGDADCTTATNRATGTAFLANTYTVNEVGTFFLNADMACHSIAHTNLCNSVTDGNLGGEKSGWFQVKVKVTNLKTYKSDYTTAKSKFMRGESVYVRFNVDKTLGASSRLSTDAGAHTGKREEIDITGNRNGVEVFRASSTLTDTTSPTTDSASSNGSISISKPSNTEYRVQFTPNLDEPTGDYNVTVTVNRNSVLAVAPWTKPYEGSGQGSIETSPCVGTDLTANARDVTLQSSPSTVDAVAGKYQKGCDLNGSTQYLFRNNDVNVCLNDDAAFFGVFRADALAATQYLIQSSSSTGGQNEFALSIATDGRVTYAHTGSGNSLTSATGVIVSGVENRVWILRKASDNTIKVKVNGALAIDTTFSSDPASCSASYTFAVGADQAGNNKLDGKVYEARIWETTLPTTTVLDRLADTQDDTDRDALAGSEVAAWMLGTLVPGSAYHMGKDLQLTASSSLAYVNRGESTTLSGTIKDAWGNNLDDQVVNFDVICSGNEFDAGTPTSSSGTYSFSWTVQTTATDTYASSTPSVSETKDCSVEAQLPSTNNVNTDGSYATVANVVDVDANYYLSTSTKQWATVMGNDEQRITGTIVGVRSQNVPNSTPVTVKSKDAAGTPVVIVTCSATTTSGVTSNCDFLIPGWRTMGTWSTEYTVTAQAGSNQNAMAATNGVTFTTTLALTLNSFDVDVAGSSTTAYFNRGETIRFTGNILHADGGCYRQLRADGTSRIRSVEMIAARVGINDGDAFRTGRADVANSGACPVTGALTDTAVPAGATDTYASSSSGQSEAKGWSIRVVDATTITNGQFETYTTTPGVPDGWTSMGGTGVAFAKETTIKRSAANAVKVTAGGTSNQGLYQSLGSLDAITYTANVWARTNGGGSEQARIEAYDATTSTVLASAQGTVGTTTFELLSVSFTGSANDLRIRLMQAEPTASSRIVYFDDAYISASNGILFAHSIFNDGTVLGLFDVDANYYLSSSTRAWTTVMRNDQQRATGTLIGVRSQTIPDTTPVTVDYLDGGSVNRATCAASTTSGVTSNCDATISNTASSAPTGTWKTQYAVASNTAAPPTGTSGNSMAATDGQTFTVSASIGITGGTLAVDIAGQSTNDYFNRGETVRVAATLLHADGGAYRRLLADGTTSARTIGIHFFSATRGETGSFAVSSVPVNSGTGVITAASTDVAVATDAIDTYASTTAGQSEAKDWDFYFFEGGTATDSDGNSRTDANFYDVDSNYYLVTSSVAWPTVMRNDQQRATGSIRNVRTSAVPNTTPVTVDYLDGSSNNRGTCAASTTSGTTSDCDLTISNTASSSPTGTWVTKYTVTSNTAAPPTGTKGNSMAATSGQTFVVSASIGITGGTLDIDIAGASTPSKLFNRGETVRVAATLLHADGSAYRRLLAGGTTSARTIDIHFFSATAGETGSFTVSSVPVNSGTGVVTAASTDVAIATNAIDTYASNYPGQSEAANWDVYFFEGGTATDGNGNGRTDANFYDVDSRIYGDVHTQKSGTLATDGLYAEIEDKLFTVGQDVVESWVHTVNARNETLSSISVTLWITMDSDSSTKVTFSPLSTDGSGWTGKFHWNPEPPIGAHHVQASASSNGNSLAESQAITLSGIFPGDPLTIVANPSAANPGETVMFVIHEALLSGEARTGNAAGTYLYVYDPANRAVVSGVNPIEIAYGSYRYTYQLATNPMRGPWVVIAQTDSGGGTINSAAGGFFVDNDLSDAQLPPDPLSNVLVGWWGLDENAGTEGGNYANNEGFETYTTTPGVPDTWTLNSGASSAVTKETTNIRSGTNAAKFAPTSSTDVRIQQTPTLTAGHSYYVEAWERTGGTGTPFLRIQQTTDTLAVVSQTGTAGGTTYEKLNGTFTAVAGKAYNIEFGTTGAANGHTVYFDDVLIQEVRTKDISKVKNHGILSGATNTAGPTIGAPGAQGYAYRFDGVDDYVTIPHAPAYDVKSVSVEFWGFLDVDPNCDGNNNYRSVVTMGSLASTTTGFDVVLEEGRNFKWDTGHGTTNRMDTTGNVVLPIRSWSHVVFTYDAASGTKKAYQDGVLKQSATGVSTVGLTANTNALTLAKGTTSGSCPNGNGYFPGKLDEVRVYNRALTDNEVKERYDRFSVTGGGGGTDKADLEVPVFMNIPSSGSTTYKADFSYVTSTGLIDPDSNQVDVAVLDASGSAPTGITLGGSPAGRMTRDAVGKYSMTITVASTAVGSTQIRFTATFAKASVTLIDQATSFTVNTEATLARIDNHVNSLWGSFNVTKAAVGRVESNLGTVSSNVNLTKAATGRIEGNLATVSTNVNTTKAAIARLESNLATVSSNVNLTKAATARLEANLILVSSAGNRTFGNVNGAWAAVNRTFGNVNGAWSAVNSTKLQTGRIESQLTATRTDLNTTKATTARVEANLNLEWASFNTTKAAVSRSEANQNAEWSTLNTTKAQTGRIEGDVIRINAGTNRTEANINLEWATLNTTKATASRVEGNLNLEWATLNSTKLQTGRIEGNLQGSRTDLNTTKATAARVETNLDLQWAGVNSTMLALDSAGNLVAAWQFNEAAGTDGANLVANPGFETYTTTPGAPDSWTALGGASVTLSKETSLKQTGSNALKVLSIDGTTTPQGVEQSLILTASKSYIVEAGVRTDGNANSLPRIEVVNTDGSTIIGSVTGTAARTYYERISLTFTSGSTASPTHKVRFIHGGTLGSNIVVYFDDIVVKEVQAKDSSINGIHATIGEASQKQGPNIGVTGKYGTAYSFDGVNDLVNVANNHKFDFTTAFTFEAWLKMATEDPAGGYFPLVVRGTYQVSGFDILASTGTTTATKYIALRLHDDSRSPTTTSVQCNVADYSTAWTHFAITVDLTASPQVTCYRNGVAIGTGSFSGAYTTVRPANANLVIGQESTRYYKGSMDEVRFHSKALTAREANIRASSQYPFTNIEAMITAVQLELDNRINSMWATVNSTKAQTGRIENNLATANSNLNTTKATVARLEGNLATVSSNVNLTKAATARLESNLNALSGRTNSTFGTNGIWAAVNRTFGNVNSAWAILNLTKAQTGRVEVNLQGARADLNTTKAGVARSEVNQNSEWLTLNTTKAQTGRIEADIVIANAHVNTTQVNLVTVNANLNTTKATAARLEGNLQGTRTDLNTTKAQTGRLESNVNLEWATLNATKTSVTTILATVARIETNVDGMWATNNLTKAATGRLEGNLATANSNLNLTKAAWGRLESNLATVSTNLNLTKAATARLESNLASVASHVNASSSSHVDSVWAAVNRTFGNVNGAWSAVNSTKLQTGRIESQLTAARTDLNTTKAAVARVEGNLAGSRTDTNMTKAQTGRIEADLVIANAHINSTQVNLATVNSNVNTTKAAAARLESNMQGTRTDLNTTKAQTGRIESNVDLQWATLNTTKTTVNAMVATLARIEANVDGMWATVNATKAQTGRVENNLATANSNVNLTKAAAARLELNLATVSTNVNLTKAATGRLESNLNALSGRTNSTFGTNGIWAAVNRTFGNVNSAWAILNLTKAQTGRVEGNLQGARTDLNTTKNAVARVEGNLAGSRTDLNTTKAAEARIEADLVIANAHVNTTQVNLATVNSNVNTTKAAAARLEGNLQSARADLNTSKARESRIESNLNLEWATLNATKTSVTTILATVARIETNVDGMWATVNTTKAQTGRIENNLATANSNVNLTKAATARLEGNLAVASTNLNVTKAATARVESNLQGVYAVANRTNANGNAAWAAVNRTFGNLNAAWSTLNTTKAQTGRIETNIQGARADLNTTKATVARVEGNLQGSRSDLNTTKATILRIEPNLATINAHLNTTQANLAVVNGNVNTTKATAARLEGNLQGARSDLNASRAQTGRIESNLDLAWSVLNTTQSSIVTLSSDLAAARAAIQGDIAAARQAIQSDLELTRDLVAAWGFDELAGNVGNNLLTNPGFETYTTSPGAPSGWTVTGAVATKDTNAGRIHGGSNSISLAPTGSATTEGASQTITGWTAGKSYLVSAYALVPSAGQTARLVIRNTADGVTVGTAFGTADATWFEFLNLTFVPVSGKTYDVWIYKGGSAGSTASVVFDDVSVQEIRSKDAWGFGYEGTLKGATTTTGPSIGVAGKPGTAYKFDGVDDYVDFGDKAAFSFPMQQFSIEFWVKPTDLTSDMGILGKRGNPWEYSVFRKSTDSSGRLTFKAWNPGGSGRCTVSPTDLALGWNHYIWTMDASGCTVYRNGVSDGTGSITGSVILADTISPFTVGMSGDATGQRFCACTIDGVRLYDRALTLRESKIRFDSQYPWTNIESLLSTLQTDVTTIKTNTNTLITKWGSVDGDTINNNIVTVKNRLGNSTDTGSASTVFGKIQSFRDSESANWARVEPKINFLQGVANSTSTTLTAFRAEVGAQGQSQTAYALLLSLQSQLTNLAIATADATNAITTLVDTSRSIGAGWSLNEVLGTGNANLASNPSFETYTTTPGVPSFWGESGTGGTFTKETSIVWSGSNAIKVVTGGTTTAEGVAQTIVGLTAGKSYVASVYARTAGVAGEQTRFKVNDDTAGTPACTGLGTTATVAYERVQCTFNANSGHSYTAALLKNSGASSIVTLYFDDVQVREIQAKNVMGVPPHGVLNNGVVNGAEGKFGAAYTLDGVDDNVLIPSNGTTMSSSFTIEAWVKPTTLRTQGIFMKNTLVAGGSAGWAGRIFETGVAGYVECDSWSGSGGEVGNAASSGANALAANVWGHVVCVYDQPSATLKLWVNGVLADTRTSVSDMRWQNPGTIELGVTATNRFAGSMDEVRVYREALTDRQVKTLYDSAYGFSNVEALIAAFQTDVDTRLTTIQTDVTTIKTNTNTLITKWGSVDGDTINNNIVTVKNRIGNSTDAGSASTIFGKVQALKDFAAARLTSIQNNDNLTQSKVNMAYATLNTSLAKIAAVHSTLNTTQTTLNAFRTEVGAQGQSRTAYQLMVDVETAITAANTALTAIKGAGFNSTTDSLHALNTNIGSLLAAVGSDGSVTLHQKMGGFTSSLNLFTSTFRDTGTLQAATSASGTLANTASSTDNFYRTGAIYIYSGTGAGQTRVITSYTGSTRVAGLSSGWDVTPTSSSKYVIFATIAPNIDSSGNAQLSVLARMYVGSGTAQSGSTSTTIKLASTDCTTTDIYKNLPIKIHTGTGSGQVRTLVGCDSTTKVATVDRAWLITPDTTSQYAVIAVPMEEGNVWATKVVAPSLADIPKTGTTSFKVYVKFLDGDSVPSKMTDPDSNQVDITAVDGSGATPAGVTLAGSPAGRMTRDAQGEYSLTVTLATTASRGQLAFTATYAKDGATGKDAASTSVVDYDLNFQSILDRLDLMETRLNGHFSTYWSQFNSTWASALHNLSRLEAHEIGFEARLNATLASNQAAILAVLDEAQASRDEQETLTHNLWAGLNATLTTASQDRQAKYNSLLENITSGSSSFSAQLAAHHNSTMAAFSNLQDFTSEAFDAHEVQLRAQFNTSRAQMKSNFTALGSMLRSDGNQTRAALGSFRSGMNATWAAWLLYYGNTTSQNLTGLKQYIDAEHNLTRSNYTFVHDAYFRKYALVVTDYSTEMLGAFGETTLRTNRTAGESKEAGFATLTWVQTIASVASYVVISLMAAAIVVFTRNRNWQRVIGGLAPLANEIAQKENDRAVEQARRARMERQRRHAAMAPAQVQPYMRRRQN